ncbi:MAG: DUF1007 family protein [Aestuariivirga sp.]|uniref:DUF1007 family protein n=1 Tax=Aestuariivirga sp. TaxID=2650926 RepID=UPI0025BB53CA|nr:DUF1007 family protein [Aestuariivirga sp.]MCA3560220.1 DUF1007 family protein [Aestuariivirga sp.]
MRGACLKALPALGILCWAAATPAQAHPHVWIEMHSGIVFNDRGLITAVNISWTFDDSYAQMALDGLDKNGDGVYDPSELEPLTRENLDSLKDYGYFTHVRYNSKPQAMGAPVDAGQIYSENRLQLHFQLPLATPLDPTKGEFVLKTYDPEFFIAFDYDKDEPVSVIGNMPKTCGPVVKPVPTDAQIEQTRAMLATKGADWQPSEEEEFGSLFAQPVTIQCKA